MKKSIKTSVEITEQKKSVIISSIKKMIEDKAVLRSFLRGQISKEVLNQKGIRIGKPI